MKINGNVRLESCPSLTNPRKKDNSKCRLMLLLGIKRGHQEYIYKKKLSLKANKICKMQFLHIFFNFLNLNFVSSLINKMEEGLLHLHVIICFTSLLFFS